MIHKYFPRLVFIVFADFKRGTRSWSCHSATAEHRYLEKPDSVVRKKKKVVKKCSWSGCIDLVCQSLPCGFKVLSFRPLSSASPSSYPSRLLTAFKGQKVEKCNLRIKTMPFLGRLLETGACSLFISDMALSPTDPNSYSRPDLVTIINI